MLKKTSSQSTWTIWASLLCLGYIALMVPRAARVVQGIGDDAEFVFSALTGALVHPPGFPIYAILSRWLVSIFDLPAYYCLSLVSVFCLSLTGFVLFYICVQLSQSNTCSAALVISFWLFGPTLKSATLVEVFPLHLLLSSSFLAAVIRYRESKARSALYVAAFLLGLGGAHHPIMVFWSPLMVWALMMRTPGSRSPVYKVGLRCLILILVGLSPYALLRIQFTAAPMLAFGQIESVTDILRHALRTDYGTFRLSAHTSENMKVYLWDFLWMVMTTMPIWLIGLVLGVRERGRQRSGSFSSLLWIVMMVHLGFLFLVRFPDQASYTILAERFYSSVLLAGMPVLAWVVASLSTLKNRQPLLLGVILLPTLVMLPANDSAADRSENSFMEAYLQECLHEVPKNGVWLTAADFDSFGAQLMHYGEGLRPDIRIIVAPRLGADWYRAQLAKSFPEIKSDLEKWFVESSTKEEYAAKISRGLIQKGIEVVTSPEGNRLPGLLWRPLGILWQHHLPDQLPSHGSTVQTVFQYCARLPDSLVLQDVDLAFHTERLEKLVLPLREARLASRASHPGAAAALRESTERIIEGDLEAARTICGRWLRR